MFDLVVRQALLVSGRVADIGVADGRIAAMEAALPLNAGPELHVGGHLTVRGYADPHMHLDKAFLAERRPNQSGTLAEAIQTAGTLKREASRDDIAQRAMRVAQMAIRNGVRAIRTHVDVDPIAGLEGLRAVLEVRKALQDQILIQVVAFPQEGLENHPAALGLLRQALAEGADVLGGIPAWDRNYEVHIDALFALAREFDVPLDLHVDESDDPATFTLPSVVKATRRYGYQGRVTVGHLCSLACVPHADAEQAIESLRSEGVGVVTLPSSNLYLQGRGDRGLIRRGMTRVREILAAGVNMAAGSDNLRDPFNPFGNACPIETAWILAHAAHMGGVAELQAAFAMVTSQAADIMGLTDWELAVGTPATFLVLPVTTTPEAVIGMVRPVHRLIDGILA
ncbi:MAG TPA: amidohydrolase family protein [Symbiobacteriaceae bacterium]|nr:amidohydrolase family protein [Symbiobacteriaceae bacterium]